ncbi:hypothetical protein BDW67DRAFT_1443 [Aspergillus spinulosporus]
MDLAVLRFSTHDAEQPCKSRPGVALAALFGPAFPFLQACSVITIVECCCCLLLLFWSRPECCCLTLPFCEGSLSLSLAISSTPPLIDWQATRQLKPDTLDPDRLTAAAHALSNCSDPSDPLRSNPESSPLATVPYSLLSVPSSLPGSPQLLPE